MRNFSEIFAESEAVLDFLDELPKLPKDVFPAIDKAVQTLILDPIEADMCAITSGLKNLQLIFEGMKKDLEKSDHGKYCKSEMRANLSMAIIACQGINSLLYGYVEKWPKTEEFDFD